MEKQTMKKIILATIIVFVAGLAATRFVSIQHETSSGISSVGESTAFAKVKNQDYDLASIVILTRAVSYINNYYYDPKRLVPDEMFEESLQSIARVVPSIMVDFDKEKRIVSVIIEDDMRSFDYSKIDTVWDIPYLIADIFEFIQPHIKNDDIDPKDVEYAAINGMLDVLDPHSLMMAPKLYSELKLSTSVSFGGLGIQIGIREGKLTVISPIEGTPAWRAGIKALDQIVRINDQSTVNMSLEEAVGLMRGDPGTPCKIAIMREGLTEARTYEIIRDIIKVQSVAHKLMPDQTAYIRLTNFQANTADDMRKALLEMKKQGGIKRIILDLRGNAGGLLDAAVKVADTFLDSGTIVSTVGASNQMKDSRDASFLGTEENLPMAVLVDSASASAAEIVAGALKNNNRAILIGDKTFGKGSVQILYDMDDGSALKLTVAQYLTPGDVSIQSVGVIPDLQLMPIYIEDDMIDFYNSDEIRRESTLKKHLVHEATIVEKPFDLIGYLYVKERDDFKPEEGKSESAFTEDFIAQFAFRLLKNLGDTSRREIMLQKSVTYLNDVRKTEEDAVEKKMAKFGIDWTSAAAPKDKTPKAEISVRVSPQETMAAGEKVEITVSVKNTGDSAFSRLWASTTSDYYLFDGMEFFFGKVLPGQSKEYTFKQEVPKDALDRIDETEFKFKGDYDYTPEAFKHEFKVSALPRPSFAFNYHIIDEIGNGDGRIQKNETVELVVDVFNVGEGTVEEGLALLRNEENLKGVFITDGRVDLEPMGPEESSEITFTFKVKPEQEEDILPMRLSIMDNKMREVLSEVLYFRIEAPLILKPAEEQSLAIIPAGTAIYGSTEENGAPMVSRTEADEKLPMQAESDNWVKVQYAEDHIGWIQKDDSFRQTNTGEIAELKPVYSHRPPVIEVMQPTLPFITDAAEIKLTGQASDEQKVSDIYILNNDQKAFYKSNQNSSIINFLAFDSKVKLEEGINHIEIVARESKDLYSVKTIVVFRKKSADTATAEAERGHLDMTD